MTGRLPDRSIGSACSLVSPVRTAKRGRSRLTGRRTTYRLFAAIMLIAIAAIASPPCLVHLLWQRAGIPAGRGRNSLDQSGMRSVFEETNSQIAVSGRPNSWLSSPGHGRRSSRVFWRTWLDGRRPVDRSPMVRDRDTPRAAEVELETRLGDRSQRVISFGQNVKTVACPGFHCSVPVRTGSEAIDR